MSELIGYDLEDGVATVTLSNGKVNAVSPEVVKRQPRLADSTKSISSGNRTRFASA